MITIKAKTFITNLIPVLACFIMFTIILSIVSYTEQHYSRTGIITGIDNDIITITDTTGNEWQYEAKGYEEGQEVTLKMYTNTTDNIIKDDVITKIIINK